MEPTKKRYWLRGLIVGAVVAVITEVILFLILRLGGREYSLYTIALIVVISTLIGWTYGRVKWEGVFSGLLLLSYLGLFITLRLFSQHDSGAAFGGAAIEYFFIFPVALISSVVSIILFVRKKKAHEPLTTYDKIVFILSLTFFIWPIWLVSRMF